MDYDRQTAVDGRAAMALRDCHSRGTRRVQRVLGCFVEFNQGWAKSAPVIGISVAKSNFDHDGNPNRHAYHEVGQAATNLAIEAAAQGLQLHQMAGIVVDKAREVLSIPSGYDPVAGFALGLPRRTAELAGSTARTGIGFAPA
jgi:nitroreductase